MDYDVFFDFRCPYVYRAALLLRRTGRSPRWRYFSLAKVNGHEDGRGEAAFAAAEAARRQGRFEPMREALLAARHERERDLDDPSALRDAAASAGLDLDAFERDLADPAILEAPLRDHAEGAERFHVFGTPTFVAPDGSAAYVRLRAVPEGPEAGRAIELIEDILTGRSYLAEVKRPA